MFFCCENSLKSVGRYCTVYISDWGTEYLAKNLQKIQQIPVEFVFNFCKRKKLFVLVLYQDFFSSFFVPRVRRVRSPPRDFYLLYNICQDAGNRTRVAATAARCAINELHTSLGILSRFKGFFLSKSSFFPKKETFTLLETANRFFWRGDGCRREGSQIFDVNLKTFFSQENHFFTLAIGAGYSTPPFVASRHGICAPFFYLNPRIF